MSQILCSCLLLLVVFVIIRGVPGFVGPVETSFDTTFNCTQTRIAAISTTSSCIVCIICKSLALVYSVITTIKACGHPLGARARAMVLSFQMRERMIGDPSVFPTMENNEVFKHLTRDRSFHYQGVTYPHFERHSSLSPDYVW